MKTEIVIGKGKITIHDVWAVSHGKVKVKLSEFTRKKVEKARRLIEKIVNEKQRVYGVNTGFGSLQTKQISKKMQSKLQKNLIRSHACSVGDLYSEPEVRAAMFIRLISNAKGNSGVRMVVLKKIVELLNKNITPVVPSQGSVGCSGDLSPLSHFILAVMGEGEVHFQGEICPTMNVFNKLGLKPVVLAEKEGLALNNGTSFMTGIAALNLIKSLNVIKTADIAGTMSVEAMQGFSSAFDEKIHKIRLHKGQGISAQNFRHFTKGSSIIDAYKNSINNKKSELGVRIQDAYTLRCFPQVHGAVRDTFDHCWKVVENEINSVTDNPLIFPKEEEVLSGGNFHGEPIALVMDFLAIALTDLGNISERRTFRLLDSSLNNGLPGCLSGGEVGLNSGLMIVQYTAASLCNENKTLSHPASVDSIPTGSNTEDHVSFGTNAANKCRQVIFNLENILAIEMLCAAQGLDFRIEDKTKKAQMGIGTQAAFDLIRRHIKKLNEDRVLSGDIKILHGLVKNEKIVQAMGKVGVKLE